MKERLTMLLACLFLYVGGVIAQTQVNGTVVSQDDGQPVIGATVQVPGTNVGTVTDMNGRFSLQLPSGKKNIRVTYVGMEPLEVSARPNMRIVLTSDKQALDEVIVVAYGTTTKSAFTGSAAVVNAEDLQVHTTSNVANALVGSVAGLQMRGSSGAPGAQQGKINIRGISSLYAETDPLVIVDGAPYEASLSNIPPSDIESVSVLKDAASAALYGARGAAGVIIITTKKGKSQDAVVNVDVKFGSNSRAVQDYDVIKSPAEFYENFYTQMNNYFLSRNYSPEQANASANRNMLNILGYNVYTIPEGQTLVGLNGKVNPNATLGRSYVYNGETYYMQPDDWTDMAYKNALRQEYTVSMNAANDRGSFYTSVGYLNEGGIIEYSGYERLSARLRADYQVKKWMKVGANVSYVHSHTSSNPNMSTDWGSTNLMYYTSFVAPIYPVYVRTVDAAGNPIIRTDGNGNPQYDYGVAATNYGVGRAFLQTGNPLGSNRYNQNINSGNQFNGNIYVDINITPNLKLNNTSTAILGQNNESIYDNALYGPKVGVNGELTKSQSNTLRQNHVQTLNYFNTFGSHNISLMVGHEYFDTKTRFLNATANGGFSPDIKELNAFATKTNSHSYTTEYNVEGFFGNAQYNYQEKYFGSASYRRDASSRFQKDHRWGSFWSVGGAWIISKEAFMQNTTTWLDMLKLKLSIGQQGNDNIGNWAYTDLYSLSKSSDTTMAPSFYRVGNEDVTWETTTNMNLGVEFGLWKGRLTGSLDFYNKKTTDLLFWLSIPESGGSRGYYGNIGDIRNTGLELTLQAVPVKTKDFEWVIAANISHNSTKILKLPETKIADNGGFYESQYWYAEGEPMFNYMTYAYAGVAEDGQALYYYDEDLTVKGKGSDATNIISKPGDSKDGTTTNIGEASRYTTGSLLPKVYGGFNTSVTWKNFDLALTFDYQLGGKINDNHYRKLMTPAASTSDAGYNYSVDWKDAWSPTNTSSDIPRWQFGDSYAAYSSDRFLTSASYLNFQSFTVGYTLPQSLTRKIGISAIRLYASGENLYFWSARKGLDPRYSYKENESVNVYSPVRTISGGIQLTF